MGACSSCASEADDEETGGATWSWGLPKGWTPPYSTRGSYHRRHIGPRLRTVTNSITKPSRRDFEQEERDRLDALTAETRTERTPSPPIQRQWDPSVALGEYRQHGEIHHHRATSVVIADSLSDPLSGWSVDDIRRIMRMGKRERRSSSIRTVISRLSPLATPPTSAGPSSGASSRRWSVASSRRLSGQGSTISMGSLPPSLSSVERCEQVVFHLPSHSQRQGRRRRHPPTTVMTVVCHIRWHIPIHLFVTTYEDLLDWTSCHSKKAV